MIAYWPSGIKGAARGGFNARVGHVMDFMSTFVELAGATYPREYKGHEIPPSAGLSLVPTFSGAKHPEEVRRLDSLWKVWAWSHQVYPKPMGR